jgi:SAM-dependent methyltransferase
MERTEYWSILERHHTIQNPTSPEKLMRLAEYCGLRGGMRVLDVGCGKAWLLRRWAERAVIAGVGLELNPWFVAEARERAATEDVDTRLTLIEGPALAFHPEPESFDIVLCIGASFAIGSFDEAVAWMLRARRPGGVIAIGEPFANEWSLPEGMLAEWGETLRDLHGLVSALESNGLTLTGQILASQDDWDHYESQHWRAAWEWADLHPTHPERGELLARVAADRERYLRWERRSLGWGIFVAR